MTDKEIIKALECCITDGEKFNCKDCCYQNVSGSCYNELNRDAIDLINRLEIENENYSHNIKKLTESNMRLHNEVEYFKQKHNEIDNFARNICKERVSMLQGKKVRCVELDKVFGSFTEAARELGLEGINISRCCRNIKGYKTAGGYHWEFPEQTKIVG